MGQASLGDERGCPRPQNPADAEMDVRPNTRRKTASQLDARKVREPLGVILLPRTGDMRTKPSSPVHSIHLGSPHRVHWRTLRARAMGVPRWRLGWVRGSRVLLSGPHERAASRSVRSPERRPSLWSRRSSLRLRLQRPQFPEHRTQRLRMVCQLRCQPTERAPSRPRPRARERMLCSLARLHQRLRTLWCLRVRRGSRTRSTRPPRG